jgi:hypothetical protein
MIAAIVYMLHATRGVIQTPQSCIAQKLSASALASTLPLYGSATHAVGRSIGHTQAL